MNAYVQSFLCRNENSLLRFQTIKQYTCHQAGEFAMTTLKIYDFLVGFHVVLFKE